MAQIIGLSGPSVTMRAPRMDGLGIRALRFYNRTHANPDRQ